jgi:hypothetical protein
MTCLTQYFKSLYFEFIKKNKEIILNSIKKTFDELIKKYDKDDFSIDFCVKFNNNKDKFKKFFS